ncbi:uncharacterized protein SCHCODRAFT_02615254 [Schizophyllum commune H4-8]|nr:uncharacterized protein SCHCODRAFT_02615254 [Schizophyllum commune H4-8]KAI5896580.1 hypothetical protein SCHCODRAFT_02615254 [Schizophyllum commune H4-8]
MEHILEELYASDDKASLKNMALAHRSLVSSCQKYIFNEVQLSEVNTNSVFSSKKTLVRKLYNTLEEFAHLSDHIRVLHLEEFWDYDSSLTWYSWMYEDKALPEVLRQVSNLEALYFQPHYMLSFAGMSQALESAIAETCALPTLTTLSMFSIRGLPLSIVEDVSPSLRYLRLWSVTCTHIGTNQPTTRATVPVHLKHLALRVDDDTFSRLLERALSHKSPIHLDRLQNLTICMTHGSSYEVATRLLEACRDTLQTLEFGDESDMALSALDLPGTPHKAWMAELARHRLRALALTMAMDQQRGGIPWICRAVEAAATVEELVLQLVVRIWDLDACTYWESDWCALDELLASDRLPKLESITIYLDVKGYTRPNSERQTYIVYDVLSLLPQVRASGRALTVETKQLQENSLLLQLDPLSRYQE